MPPKRLDILVAGMDKITDKSSYIYDALQRKGLKCMLYSRDRTGLHSKLKDRIQTEVEIAPPNVAADVAGFARLLIERRPRHVEMYGGALASQMGYVAACAALRVPFTYVCIGELYYWEQHHPLHRLIDRVTYRMAKMLVLTELYMEDTLKKHSIASVDKTVFFHNRIPVSPPASLERPGRVVLFLNSFKPWRKPDLLIEAAPLVLERVPDARFELVGSVLGLPYLRGIHGYEKKLQARIDELGVGDRVTIVPFAHSPRPHYERAAVFVLPADLVYCNFSLLEAMERSTPPIVADVDGAERIVEHEVSGLRVPQDPQALAAAIVRLLTDEDTRRRMGAKAREAILRTYDIDRGVEDLVRAYRERIAPGYGGAPSPGTVPSES